MPRSVRALRWAGPAVARGEAALRTVLLLRAALPRDTEGGKVQRGCRTWLCPHVSQQDSTAGQLSRPWPGPVSHPPAQGPRPAEWAPSLSLGPANISTSTARDAGLSLADCISAARGSCRRTRGSEVLADGAALRTGR